MALWRFRAGCVFIFILLMATVLVNCAGTDVRRFGFSLHNTVSIFLLQNETRAFFSIPIQYLGDFHIGGFEFIGGLIVIGDHEIPLRKDNVNVFVYLNQKTDGDGSLTTGFDLVFAKERGDVSVSRMSEPLAARQAESDGNHIHYYVFIERFLEAHELEGIKSEYARGNMHSRYEVWFNLVIDGEPQLGSGVADGFTLYKGPASEAVFLFPNLNFFRARYF